MQSFRFREIFQASSLRFSARYTLYKDSKAKVANMLAMVGYPLLIYFLVSLFTPLLPIYPIFSLSWWLSVFVTFMMLERQIFRGIAIYRVYGMRSVFFGCLLPPLMPIRLIWGNIINLAATARAYRQYFAAGRKKAGQKAQDKHEADSKTASPEQRKIAWSKTDHQFLGQAALQRYRRNLGDILLEKGYLSTRELSSTLLRARGGEQRLGAILVSRGLLTEEQLLDALSEVKHIQFVELADLDDYAPSRFAGAFQESLLKRLMSLPLLKTADGYVFAFSDQSPIDAQTTLRNTYGIGVHAVFASQQAVEAGLARMYGASATTERSAGVAEDLFQNGVIGYEQLILANTYRQKSGMSEQETLAKMGLLA